MEGFFRNVIVGISVGSVYSLVGLGIVIIYKSSKIFNFSLGAVVGLGAFIFLGFAINLRFPILFSIVLTLIAGLIIGIATERIFLRPMIGQPLLASIMMTLALGSFYEGVVFLVGGGSFKAFIPILKTDIVSIGRVTVPSLYIFTILIVLCLFIFLGLFFKFTKIGLGMRAAAEDHKVAQSKGIRVTKVFELSWGICLAVCCLGGILTGSITSSASHLLIGIALKAFPVVLCGGLESFLGCMIVGPIMGLAEVFSVTYLGSIIRWSGIDDVVPYIIMFFIMIFKPEGLFGLKRIERI